jgi:hypothetical protein
MIRYNIIEIMINGIPKERPNRQNGICCRLVLLNLFMKQTMIKPAGKGLNGTGNVPVHGSFWRDNKIDEMSFAVV